MTLLLRAYVARWQRVVCPPPFAKCFYVSNWCHCLPYNGLRIHKIGLTIQTFTDWSAKSYPNSCALVNWTFYLWHNDLQLHNVTVKNYSFFRFYVRLTFVMSIWCSTVCSKSKKNSMSKHVAPLPVKIYRH